MTRKEAIMVICKQYLYVDRDDIVMPNKEPTLKAYKMAIKALEQEPCEDCVSKKEVLKQIKEWRDNEFIRVTNPYHYLEKRLSELSSVNPQESKSDRALRLLAEWVTDCGFGYDNIPDEYEKYKDEISDMDYIDGLVYIVKKEA